MNMKYVEPRAYHFTDAGIYIVTTVLDGEILRFCTVRCISGRTMHRGRYSRTKGISLFENELRRGN